jgi:hypothetical protein
VHSLRALSQRRRKRLLLRVVSLPTRHFFTSFPVAQASGHCGPNFFSESNHRRSEFFDHSKVYEFRLERDTTCDETVASISEAKDKGARGAVPEDLALHILKGAPKELLRPDRMLPCYTLRQGKYKLVSQDKQQSAAQPVIDPATGDLHLQLPIAPTQTKQ